MQQKLFQNFFQQKKLELLEVTIKKLQKLRQKLKRYVYYISREFLLCLQSSASSLLQKCINFVEQRLNFSHFEGSIIP